jgi:hypothetical protein
VRVYIKNNTIQSRYLYQKTFSLDVIQNIRVLKQLQFPFFSFSETWRRILRVLRTRLSVRDICGIFQTGTTGLCHGIEARAGTQETGPQKARKERTGRLAVETVTLRINWKRYYIEDSLYGQKRLLLNGRHPFAEIRVIRGQLRAFTARKASGQKMTACLPCGYGPPAAQGGQNPGADSRPTEKPP